MLKGSYLDANIYHMVHFKNIESIFKHGALYSLQRLRRQKITPFSIANSHIQDLRDRIFIQHEEVRSLHNYVPFYFAMRTPMLHAQDIEVRKHIVIFAVSRLLLEDKCVLFTDGNATNQQLSAYKGETVWITPAAINHTEYRRVYRPGGPYGTNNDRSNFYADPMFLRYLNWDVIEGRRSVTNQTRRMKQAEVLIYDQLSLKHVKGIFTCNSAIAQSINHLIARYPLLKNIRSAECRPEMFQ